MNKGTIVENAVTQLNRRVFLKSAAISALGMTSLGTLVGCSPQSSVIGITEPWEAASQPNQTGKLTLDEVNAIRKKIIDSKKDFIGADGTVIPAVYVKVRTLIDTIGFGVGSDDLTAASFAEVMYLFSEEEAQAYLDMPRGVYFTATDFSVESGRDEEECLKICEDLATRGLLFRTRRAGVPYFHLVAYAHGIWEYSLLRKETQTPEFVNLHKKMFGSDVKDDEYNAETPFYYAIPVDKEVVADEKILAYDDYEKIISRNSVIAVSPCQCRMSKKLIGTTDPNCTHPLETCITTGEEAEFYLENGIARQITQEEALKILRNAVDMGMVLQSSYTKATEVICCCHGDCCDILRAYVALGDDYANYNSSANVSHYNLKYDKDACVKCGACETRCPLFAVSKDGEGYPATGLSCIRCGQCGVVCPVGARKLVQKEDILELPDSMLDDYNLKSEYRIRNGMVY